MSTPAASAAAKRGLSALEHTNLTEGLRKLAKVMSQKHSIEVIFAGNRAYTNGRRIVVPELPVGCSHELVEAMHGFIDHEVAHILKTDMTRANKVLFDRRVTTKNEELITQLIEDARIEARMAEDYVGCGLNFERMYRWAIKRIEDAGQWGKMKPFAKLAALMRFRALYYVNGDPFLAEFLEREERGMAHMLDLVDDELHQWPDVPDTMAALEMAKAIVKKLGEAAKEQHEQDPDREPGEDDVELDSPCEDPSQGKSQGEPPPEGEGDGEQEDEQDEQQQCAGEDEQDEAGQGDEDNEEGEGDGKGSDAKPEGDADDKEDGEGSEGDEKDESESDAADGGDDSDHGADKDEDSKEGSAGGDQEDDDDASEGDEEAEAPKRQGGKEGDLDEDAEENEAGDDTESSSAGDGAEADDDKGEQPDADEKEPGEDADPPEAAGGDDGEGEDDKSDAGEDVKPDPADGDESGDDGDEDGQDGQDGDADQHDADAGDGEPEGEEEGGGQDEDDAEGSEEDTGDQGGAGDGEDDQSKLTDEERDELEDILESGHVPSNGGVDAADSVMAKAMDQLKHDFSRIDSFKVLTTEFDVSLRPACSEEVDKKVTPEVYAQMREQVIQSVGAAYPVLSRLLRARTHSLITGGRHSGKVHASSVAQIRVGNFGVFQRKQEAIDLDSYVELVIDGSGSMGGKKIQMAALVAICLAELLDKSKVPFGVCGFTDAKLDHHMQPPERQKLARSLKRSPDFSDDGFHRINALIEWVYKTPEETLAQAKLFLAKIDKVNYMSANADGDSILRVAKRVLKRREKRKIIMVLSDGRPASDCGDNVPYDCHDTRLRDVIAGLSKVPGLEMIGIGIMDASVQSYYPKWAVVRQLDELPKVMLQQLGAFLREGLAQARK